MSAANMKAKLANGEAVFGTFFQFVTHPAVVEALPDQGLDFVIVNNEHNSLDLHDFMGLQYALRSKGIACLVRVHSHDPFDIARACDVFADGVVVPYVEDPDEMRRFVAACKYRPLKGRALDRLIANGEWPSEKTKSYIQAKSRDIFFAAMIESVEALKNLPTICEMEGIDALFVGPNDLTVSMGIPEERNHPEFVEALQQLIDTAGKHGIAAGAHFSELEHARRLLTQGGRFIPFSSDLRLIQNGVPAFLHALQAGSVVEGGPHVI